MEFAASVIAGVVVAAASVFITDQIRALRARHDDRVRKNNLLSALSLELAMNIRVVSEFRAPLQRTALDAALQPLAEKGDLYHLAIQASQWIQTYNAWVDISNYFDAQPVPGYKHKIKAGQAIPLEGIDADDIIIRPAVPNNLLTQTESAMQRARRAIDASLSSVPRWWEFWT